MVSGAEHRRIESSWRPVLKTVLAGAVLTAAYLLLRTWPPLAAWAAAAVAHR